MVTVMIIFSIKLSKVIYRIDIDCVEIIKKKHVNFIHQVHISHNQSKL